MDWVYLAFSVNGALYSVNAYRPIKRNPLFLVWSFFASWITIELAWVHLVWQVGLTAFFVRKGVLRSRRGQLGLLINLASWLALVLAIKRSLDTRHEVRAAFKDFPTAPRITPGQGRKVTRNLTFRQIGKKAVKLDVYEPARPVAPVPGEAPVRRPAIMQIHGGAWVVGDKREQGLPLLKHLVDQGWVGFNVNYRLSPKVAFPDHLIDLKHAIAWIRQHADEYDIDPDFIAVTGGSAGGHLTALMALTANDPRYQEGFDDVDTSFQAAVPFYGVYDFTNRDGYFAPNMVPRFLGPVVMKAKLEDEPEKFAAASPLDQVRPDAPPFLVVHGSLDTLAPVEGARDFVASLREVSHAPVLYLELQGAQHAFDLFGSIRANEVVRAVAQFLNVLYAEHVAGAEPADVPVSELTDVIDAVRLNADA